MQTLRFVWTLAHKVSVYLFMAEGDQKRILPRSMYDIAQTKPAQSIVMVPNGYTFLVSAKSESRRKLAFVHNWLRLGAQGR